MDCKECAKLRIENKKKSNPDDLKKRWEIYYAKNGDRIRAMAIDYRKNNPEKIQEYLKNNPDVSRRNRSNRRARILNIGGELSSGLQKKLFELQRGHCAICKNKLSNNIKHQHMDHIIPVSPRKGDKAGTNTDDNIQLLCKRCNSKKHNKDPLKFMQEMGYLL